MLEIILMIVLTRKLVEDAKAKGRSGWWGALAVAGWLTGEILGGVVGFLLGLEGFALYVPALIGAGLGYLVARIIVSNLSNKFEEDGFVPMDSPGYEHYDPNNPYSPPKG